MNCPNCGSSNIQFKRENQGEIRNKRSKTVIHKTIGFCKDCGTTWNVDGNSSTVTKRKTWAWVLGWLFIFPIPLTILLFRKKNMAPVLKYGIIAAAWIIYLLIGFAASSKNNNGNEENETPPVETITVSLEVEPKVNAEDGSVLFAIKTNLPEDTRLLITVSDGASYTAQDHATILNNGEGYTTEFSNHGEALKGTYTVSVSMGLPKLQKQVVQDIIGKNGENIKGPFVVKDDASSANMVSGTFEFTFGQ